MEPDGEVPGPSRGTGRRVAAAVTRTSRGGEQRATDPPGGRPDAASAAPMGPNDDGVVSCIKFSSTRLSPVLFPIFMGLASS